MTLKFTQGLTSLHSLLRYSSFGLSSNLSNVLSRGWVSFKPNDRQGMTLSTLSNLDANQFFLSRFSLNCGRKTGRPLYSEHSSLHNVYPLRKGHGKSLSKCPKILRTCWSSSLGVGSHSFHSTRFYSSRESATRDKADDVKPSKNKSSASECAPSEEAEYAAHLIELQGCAEDTVGAAMLQWCRVLQQAGVPEPVLSVQHVAAHVFETTRALLRPRASISPGQRLRLDRLLTCRQQRMPVQYIVGGWDFHGISLELWPPVFIPRQETEGLVELALEELGLGESGGLGLRETGEKHVLELCSGSGAVSLALLAASGQIRVTAVEQSGNAIAVATHNALRLGVADRFTLLHHKLSPDKAPPLPRPSYDLVVANPPYLYSGDLRRLAPEVCLYEDMRALDGGADGLTLVKLLLRAGPGWLGRGGVMLLEVEPRHGDLVRRWLAAHPCGMTLAAVLKDVFGRDRFLRLVRE